MPDPNEHFHDGDERPFFVKERTIRIRDEIRPTSRFYEELLTIEQLDDNISKSKMLREYNTKIRQSIMKDVKERKDSFKEFVNEFNGVGAV